MTGETIVSWLPSSKNTIISKIPSSQPARGYRSAAVECFCTNFEAGMGSRLYIWGLTASTQSRTSRQFTRVWGLHYIFLLLKLVNRQQGVRVVLKLQGSLDWGGVIEGRDTHRGQATRTPSRGSGRSSLCRGATWDKYMFVLIN